MGERTKSTQEVEDEKRKIEVKALYSENGTRGEDKEIALDWKRQGRRSDIMGGKGDMSQNAGEEIPLIEDLLERVRCETGVLKRENFSTREGKRGALSE